MNQTSKQHEVGQQQVLFSAPEQGKCVQPQGTVSNTVKITFEDIEDRVKYWESAVVCYSFQFSTNIPFAFWTLFISYS